MHRIFLACLVIACIGAADEPGIPGIAMGGIAADARDGSDLMIQAGVVRYLATAHPSHVAIRMRVTVDPDGRTSQEKAEGIVVGSDGGRITTVSGIASGTAVRILLGSVMLVWMFPSRDADGREVPAGWHVSVAGPTAFDRDARKP